eukprot:GEMP01090588.1.p1 GENE.GEMP01090588.1~~GEMP01090588.1.p1  ORF type:complete len:134 (-),score=4.80 GEMP01090588.1:256-657(-)
MNPTFFYFNTFNTDHPWSLYVVILHSLASGRHAIVFLGKRPWRLFAVWSVDGIGSIKLACVDGHLRAHRFDMMPQVLSRFLHVRRCIIDVLVCKDNRVLDIITVLPSSVGNSNFPIQVFCLLPKAGQFLWTWL